MTSTRAADRARGRRHRRILRLQWRSPPRHWPSVVDLVVNNAGLSIPKPVLKTTMREWDLQHNVMARERRRAARLLVAETADVIRSAVGRAAAVGADVRTPDGCASAVHAAVAALGEIDLPVKTQQSPDRVS